jgi:hypothetical protein
MRPRSVLAGVCAVLAVVALAVGGVFVYARIELLDSQRFADRAVDALHDPTVRGVVADRVVTTAIDHGSRDLLTARPLLVNVVDTVILTRPFENLFHAAVVNAHRLLFSRNKPTISVDLRNVIGLVQPALRSVDPQLADQLPRRLKVPLAKLDERSFAADTLQAADDVRALAIVLPILAVLLLTGAVWLAADRRAALRRAPLAVAAAAGIVIVALLVAQPGAARAVHGLSHGEADAAVGGVWEAMVGDLRLWAIGFGLGGLAVVALLSPRLRLVVGPARAAARAVFARPADHWVAAGRGVALVAAGLLILAAPNDVLRALGYALAGLIIAMGVAEVIMAVAGRARLRRQPVADEGGLDEAAERLWREHPVGRVAVMGTTLAALGIAIAVLVTSAGGQSAKRRARGPITSCNGSVALCSRRFNEVFFPGTHNSMSAADSPGWLIANQRRDIPHQLRDGIRLFLIDTHWGVHGPHSRIRTDLAAEGTTRNRVAKALGSPAAIRLAERVAGRIGLGNLKGQREVWLCHSLCELGATNMQTTLRQYRSFLDAHPDQFVVLFLEPSVPSWAIEREFARAGLIDRIATLPRDRPMPTLGSLLRSGKQMVVLGEHDTEGVPWYLDGFSYIQDTPLGKHSGTSCARYRGQETSPIFMINGWSDRFPPLPSADLPLQTRARLLERIRRCTRVRGMRPAFYAVDHYDEGQLLQVAKVING